MSNERKEDFIRLLLDKLRTPESFGGRPFYAGLSIPEAINRWMAFELAKYLDFVVGRNAWYPLTIQSSFNAPFQPVLESWRLRMRVNDRGPVNFSMDRQLVGQDYYRLDLARSRNLAKRSVWGFISPPTGDDNMIYVISHPNLRVDYTSDGYPIVGTESSQPR
jgi:hypothetical protein